MMAVAGFGVRRWLGRLAVLALVVPAAACSHRLSAAQIAVLKAQGFAPKEDTWQLGLTDKMLFDTDSDRLKEPTRVAIEHTGGALGSVGIRNVRVDGHTDNTGSAQHNLELSQRRAAAVAQALDKLGTVGAVGVHGYGTANPVGDNSTEAGRAENRRVSVIVPDNQE